MIHFIELWPEKRSVEEDVQGPVRSYLWVNH